MKKGFTLIELLIVVLIIGILAAIAMPYYQRTVERSRFSEAISLTRTIDESVKRYFMAGNTRHATLREMLDIELTGGDWNEDGSMFTTKYYTYSGSCTTADVYKCYAGGINVARIPKEGEKTEYDFYIQNYTDGTANKKFNYYSDKYTHLCQQAKDLGLQCD